MQAVAPNTVCFDTLYERFRPLVRRRLTSILVKYPNEVEDALQDTFLKVWRSLERVQSDSNLQAWVMRIATNTALDVLRARRLTMCQSLDAIREGDNGETASLRDQLPDRFDWFSQYEDCEQLMDALNQLPARYRQALMLMGAGYTPSEIATRLHLTPCVCKTVLWRARQALRLAQQKTSPMSLAAVG